MRLAGIAHERPFMRDRPGRSPIPHESAVTISENYLLKVFPKRYSCDEFRETTTVDSHACRLCPRLDPGPESGLAARRAPVRRVRAGLRGEGLGGAARSPRAPGRPGICAPGRHARGLEARPPGPLAQAAVETVELLAGRGIGLRSLTESIDTGNTGGKLVFHVFGALAEFERSIIRERTKAALEAARARGRTGGPPRP